MLKISDSFFRSIQEAIWIVDNQNNVISRTEAAEILERKYRVNLKSIVEISQGQGCALHSTKEECLNCPLDHQVSPTGFPFMLLDQQGKSEEFWGRVDSTDDQIMIQIRPKRSLSVEPSFFDYLNNAREVERKKISQDLHDGIAQSVYSLMLETRSLKWLAGDDQVKKMEKIDLHFSEVLTEVRDMASELRPLGIDSFGLMQALEQFVERTVEMTGFEIDLLIHGEEQSISESIRIVIYRIIQEALNNAMKYSGENQMNLLLDFQPKQLFVEVKDAGMGFDFLTVEKGYGLANMRERAHSIGGDLMIYSQVGKGTTIQLRVPLEEGQEL